GRVDPPHRRGGRGGGDEDRPQSGQGEAGDGLGREAGARGAGAGSGDAGAARRAAGRDRGAGPVFHHCAGPWPGAAAVSGWLKVVGLGPGAEALVTPEVAAVLEAATDVVGYIPYVA